jgi:hypothetical protein
MPKTQFLGRVFPTAPDVWHRSGSKIRWQVSDTGITADFEVKIEHSIVTVECECQNDLTTELTEALFIRAFDLARATVDMISFSTGRGLIVMLEKIVRPTGEESEICPEDLTLGPLCTAFGTEPEKQAEFLMVYKIVLEQPAIFMALNDLITAISYPHYAPVNCGRDHRGNPTFDRTWTGTQETMAHHEQRATA